ncbi:hypothetical protein [Jatrophihabitans sp.]|uniref:hypothetical protein n=1 Tax=Jatrophihabitans sp. TaxID=1932789 RepID=UPI0030C7309A|nr:hypothetical protein [Jatrophihabitans sp.]
MRSRLVTTLVCGAVVGVLAVPAQAGATSVWASVPQFSVAQPNAVQVTGQLTGGSGSPAAGATVVLLAEPSGAALEALPDGGTASLSAISQTTADAAGTYSVGIPAGTSLDGVADPTGVVNLVALAVSGTSIGVTYLSTPVATSSSSGLHLAAAPADDEPTAVVDAPIELTGTSDSATPLSGGPPTCSVHKIHTYGPREVVVGSTYSYTSHASETFTYSKGTNSSLGVGVNYAMTGGSFEASGTHSVSSDSSITFPTESGAKNTHFITWFDYAEFGASCGSRSWRSVEATDWDGGSKISTASSLTATHCLPYASGSTFTNTHSSAFDYSNGSLVSDIVGISLSARTGYSTSATLLVHLTADSRLCGYKGYPNASSPAPQLVVAYGA